MHDENNCVNTHQISCEIEEKKTTTIPSICFVMHMENVAELHKALLPNDFRGCFDAWKTHMEQYVTGDGNYYEGNSM